MKKLLALALVVFGLAACQTEPEGFDVTVNGEVPVTVTVDLADAVGTRADSAEGAIDNGVVTSDDYTLRYALQVFNENGTASKAIKYKYSDNTSVAFDLRLVPNRNYKFVVWADIVDTKNQTPTDGEQCADLHYAIGADLRNITLVPGSWKAMDETRDAYTGVYDANNFNAAQNITIKLTRPFAKLRVVTTDIAELFDGVVPAKAVATYSTKHRASFDAFAKTAGEATLSGVQHTFDIAGYNEGDDAVATNKTLFVDYFFAAEQDDVVNFTLDVQEANGTTIKSNTFNTPIPVKRNFLTTIKGNVLTEGDKIIIDIEDGFAGEIGEEDGKTFAKVDTVNELLWAINEGVENIILEGDNAITVNAPVSIPAGVTTTLDLNGRTITGGKQTDPTKSIYAIENRGTLTLKNGTINSRGVGNYGTLIVEDGVYNAVDNNGGAAIWNYTGSNVTINGGTFTAAEADAAPAATTMHVADGATAVVNGGTFKSNADLTYAIISDGDLTVNDATVTGEHGAIAASAGTLTVNGGYYEVAGNNSSSNHVIYTPNGNATINDGTFKFSQTNASSFGGLIICGAADVNGGTFDSVNGAFASNGQAGLVIYGGTFKNKAITVYGGDFAQFVAPGYAVVDNDNEIYTVVNLRASEVEIYGLTLKPNGNNSKIIVKDKEGLLNLTKLFNNWTDLFTDGNGTTFTNYANGAGADYYYSGRWTVSLEADIDLNNANISPIIIKHPVSAGSLAFEGNNHTIKNAQIVTDPATENRAGLFETLSNCGFSGLKLDNIHVTGSNVGNSTAGVLAGSNNVVIDNITITNSSVVGGKYTGGVVGYGYTDVTNCSLTNVSVKGGYKQGGLIGYICNGDTGEVTGNTLTNCSVNGIGGGTYAGGKSEYIIGMLVGNYNCDGTCKDNVVYDMTTTATKVIGKIEAGMVVNESNNIVTYVVENYEELKTAVINGGKVELANDITVDEWIMFSEDYNISSGQIITIDEINVTIDGKDHTLTVNAIKSAGNGNLLFQGASVLNISNLTITYADGLAGGLGMDSGVIKNVRFIGGGNAIYPHSGEILVEECIFNNNGNAFYFEHECDNLTVTGCTFNQKANQNVILLRGDVKFTDNIINSGRTVNVVSGSPVVTGNDFKDVRFKVYGAATATISNNIINNLEFDGPTYASTFTNNTLSSEAQAKLAGATKVN